MLQPGLCCRMVASILGRLWEVKEFLEYKGKANIIPLFEMEMRRGQGIIDSEFNLIS